MNQNHEIMSRIKMVNRTRFFFTLPFISSCAIVAFTVWTAVVVSLRDVMVNTMAQPNLNAEFTYILSSLLHSRMIVQILVSLIVCGSGIVALHIAAPYARKLLRFSVRPVVNYFT